jgi:S-methylmethionine-dependent homocysteine/selenocysteine methylase
MYRRNLPQLSDQVFLTDSGIETDLIFNGGWELPEFAAFVLLDDPAGSAALRDYFLRHVAVADTFGCGLILEAPTWRASRDWGARLGYSAAQLRDVNERAISLLADIRSDHANTGSPIVISGCIGPQSDAYEPGSRMTADEAQEYHRDQIESLAATEADVVHAMTITYTDEAIGITRAAIHAGLPVVISFTTEIDGRLPDGTSLADAIAAVDRATDSGPAYYGINCAHPTHFGPAFPADDGSGRRIRSIRANASSKSHAELDESATLDAGDPAELAGLYRALRADHPQLTILGGCCGTDAAHVAAIAQE